MKKIMVFAPALIFVFGCVQQTTTTNTNSITTTTVATNTNTVTSTTTEPVRFETSSKSPHYESNAPEHGAVLPAAPYTVVIDFNFDVVAGSTISIFHNGADYGEGDTTIDNNQLALRRRMLANAPDGLYSVEYSACWPDGSCHSGSFQFAVDSSLADQYSDWRGQTAVAVDLKDSAFSPVAIRISRGTTITWKNSDSIVHYVNTDSHPAHTFFADQNSSALEQNATYSTTFSEPGVYPYHCSAHADTMTGTILVE